MKHERVSIYGLKREHGDPKLPIRRIVRPCRGCGTSIVFYNGLPVEVRVRPDYLDTWQVVDDLHSCIGTNIHGIRP